MANLEDPSAMTEGMEHVVFNVGESDQPGGDQDDALYSPTSLAPSEEAVYPTTDDLLHPDDRRAPSPTIEELYQQMLDQIETSSSSATPPVGRYHLRPGFVEHLLYGLAIGDSEITEAMEEQLMGMEDDPRLADVPESPHTKLGMELPPSSDSPLPVTPP